jgi:hypothetical protein
MTFSTAIPSGYSNAEVCVSFNELEETMFTQSYRGLENYVTRRIDNDSEAIATLRSQGREEKCVERSNELQQINLRHSRYIADTRKALAFCCSKVALRVLISEMNAHDSAMNAKAGRQFCNTTEELERAIESVQLRLSANPQSKSIDVFLIARREILNRGSIRLEMLGTDKRIKVKYAMNMGSFKDLASHGWQMVIA